MNANVRRGGDGDAGSSFDPNGDPALPHSHGDPSEVPVRFEYDRAAWAAQNDRFRNKSMAFLNIDGPRPVARVIILRMCMAPLQTMEKDEFWIGSKKWKCIFYNLSDIYEWAK